MLKLSRFFLYAALFSVVIVLTSAFFPFIGGKAYFFRVTVELALICAVLGWAFAKQPAGTVGASEKRWHSPLFLAVTIFALVFLLAGVLANDPAAGFWSNYERGEGGFQMFHYYTFFALAVLLLSAPKEWRAALKVYLAAAAGMILYGVASAALVPGFFGVYAGAPGGFFRRLFLDNLRFQGSLGNSEYVPAYLMFAAVFALYLWLGKTERRKDGWRNLGYGALLTTFLLFFILSQTRGAFLGLAVAVVAALAYVIFTRPRARILIGGLLIALIVAGGATWYFRSTPLIRSIPGSRVLDISLAEGTAQTRVWTWRAAWAGFKERPLLGWGPENFTTVFDAHFDPRHYNPNAASETWFDRAHSVIFDYLAETGALGLLSYLSMLIVFYVEFFRRRLAVRAIHPVIRAAFFALPLGYLVQGLFMFDVLPIYISLFLFFALAIFTFSTRLNPKK